MVLVLVLVARVLEHLLLLARASHCVQRTLRERGGAVGHLLNRRGSLLGDIGTGDIHRLGFSAECLDAPLQLARVALRLAQVLLEALLVRRARCHRDVRLQRRLELLLFPVRLVEVLNQLRVSGIHFRHTTVPS
ncbi:MAG TPA: hypothetical protein VF752_08825 [Thermoleophilaceae bacterium]